MIISFKQKTTLYQVYIHILILSITYLLISCHTNKLTSYPPVLLPISAMNIKKGTLADGTELTDFSIKSTPEKVIKSFQNRLKSSGWVMIEVNNNTMKYKYKPDIFHKEITLAISASLEFNNQTRVFINIYETGSNTDE